MEEFKRSKEAEAKAELPPEGAAFYAVDSHGTPHFALSREEALEKARVANEGYN